MKVVIQKPAYESYVQRYYDKTIGFVHKATEVERLEKELPVITFDENYPNKLEEKIKDKKEKQPTSYLRSIDWFLWISIRVQFTSPWPKRLESFHQILNAICSPAGSTKLPREKR